MSDPVAKFYDELAREKMDRDISHILLIHMNRINAEYLGDILDWYMEKDWKFVSLEQALKDPVYKKDETYIGSAGLSWLQRF